MKIKKIILKLVMFIGVGFILLPSYGQVVLAFTSENISTTENNVKVDLKQIKEIAKPTWSIIHAGDSRDGRISQSLAATVVAIVNSTIENDGWLSASSMLSWLYPQDTIEQLKSENVTPEQAIAWLNSIGYTASLVNRPMTTDEIKKSLDKSSPIVTIFESQDPANWLEKETTGVLYGHSDVEAGTGQLHKSFLKTAYHGELTIQDGTEQSPFVFEDQYENPSSKFAASKYLWTKSITDIQKDPTWDSRETISGERATGVFNVDLTYAGQEVKSARFTDPDVLELRRHHPKTTPISETKLAAVDLINLYFDENHQKTVTDLETFAKIDSSKDVTGSQIVSWYKSLGFSCETSEGKLTKALTKSLASAGKLYLTTYKAIDSKEKYQQLSTIGAGFDENNTGYTPDLMSVLEDENMSVTYNVNWSSPNAYDEFMKKNKAFDYDYFLQVDIGKSATYGKYQSDLTIYNIRQKDSPDVGNTQFEPTKPVIAAPQQTASYNSNTNFGIRETQGQEPWCASYVGAAAINTFRKVTDNPITSAKAIMQAKNPGLSDEELSKTRGGTIENSVNIYKSKYNIGVTVENRTLSFQEVKREIDNGRIIEMDAYNINATTSEEKNETGHALAIVGYVTPSDGDPNKVPYYEVWNPWWGTTFYIPADNSSFRIGGIDYKWERSWYNWRQDGPVSVDAQSAQEKVASIGNPAALTHPKLPKNPLLVGQNNYSAFEMLPLRDVMTDQLAAFGRETTVESKTIGATFGYAFSNGSGEFMRAKKNKSTKTTQNMNLAKEFSDGVDSIISARNEFIAYGFGTMVFMSVYIAIQFIPVANWLSSGTLWLISFITNAGPGAEVIAIVNTMRNYYNSSQITNEVFAAM